MSTQPSTRPEVESRPPWAPFSVSLIALILPAGGVILTIANLHRLRELNSENARRITVAAYVVLATGYALLLLYSKKNSSGFLQPDIDAGTVLSCGVALASYIAQRQPYRAWRKSHERAETSSWLGGAGRAAVYSLITFVAVLPIFLAGVALGFGNGSLA